MWIVRSSTRIQEYITLLWLPLPTQWWKLTYFCLEYIFGQSRQGCIVIQREKKRVNTSCPYFLAPSRCENSLPWNCPARSRVQSRGRRKWFRQLWPSLKEKIFFLGYFYMHLLTLRLARLWGLGKSCDPGNSGLGGLSEKWLVGTAVQPLMTRTCPVHLSIGRSLRLKPQVKCLSRQSISILLQSSGFQTVICRNSWGISRTH